MTEYAPASGQDRNSSYYSNPHLVSPHYTNGNGINYFYPQGQIQYPTATVSSYSTYPSSYMASPQQHPNHHMYMSNGSSMGMPYQLTPPTRPYSQSRTLSYPPNTGYHSSTVPTQRMTTCHQPRMTFPGELGIDTTELEGQDSVNEDTMISEPILPPLEGYPSVESFDRMVAKYVDELSPKKRDKALITARRARNIRTVLMDKKTTSIESAQFRFWVKKMFQLKQCGPSGTPKSICHEMKPVAVREKLFKILTRAHKACQHGGRDKTSLQVRRVYSWVPKELISRFVKECPTCKIRRPSNQRDVDMVGCGDEVDSPVDCENDTSPPPALRRGSVMTSKRESISSPLSMGFSATFASQNRWMSDLPNIKTKPEYYDTASYPGHDHSHVSSPNYSSRISQQMNNLSFTSADSAMSGISSPSGFPSSSVRSTGNWHNSAYSGYPIKHERHGERYIKSERHH